VIRNGRVLDGAGNPWIAADVANQERSLCPHRQNRRKREIDARSVSPGWIDMRPARGSVRRQKNRLAEAKYGWASRPASAAKAETPVNEEAFAGISPD